VRYGLYIFDLDGTLLDTSPGIIETVRYMERTLGLPPVPQEQLRGFIGPPLEDSFARFYHAGPEEAQRLTGIFREKYLVDGVCNAVVYPGILEILDAIDAAGALAAVATLKHHSATGKALGGFGLTPRFAAIAAGTDQHPSKADLIRQAMRELKWTDRSTVLMMGDSRYDGEGAMEAGVDFVPLTYGFGFGEPGSLDGLPAVFTAETPEALVEFILDCLKP